MTTQTITPPTTKTLFKENFGHIFYDLTTNIISAKWIGFLKVEDLRRAYPILVDAARQYRISNHLSDQTELKVLSREIQEMLVTEIFPAFEKAGIRKVAVQLAGDLFAQATVNNVNMKASLGKITICQFGSVNSAHEWLLS